jgi:molecular chaperone DnaK
MGPVGDDDPGFPNIGTEKGLVDLDLPPSSTAKGFAPPPALTAPSLPVAPPPAPTAPSLPATAPPALPPAPSFVAPQAYPVMSAKPSPVVMDVTPRGLGIATVAGFCEELIRRNSRVPTEIRKMFSTSRDYQDSVHIVVCQGESRRLQQNVVIGELRLEGLPRRPRGETTIEVTFMLDANGILQVRARDAQTGREQRVTLDTVGSIPQQDLSASRERLQALRR